MILFSVQCKHSVGFFYSSRGMMGRCARRNAHVFVSSCRVLVVCYLVNTANSVHYLFLVYLSTSTCFGPLCAHHQEKQLCLCDTRYLLFCVDGCLVCRSICSCIPDSYPHRITSTECRINTVVSPDDGHIVARNM